MKVVCFLLTVLAAAAGQPTPAPTPAPPCPTRPVTNPYHTIYKDMLAPDRDVRCCEFRIDPILSPRGPPLSGDSCTNRVKTCFFGSQTCPDGTIHPTERSDCDGNQYTTSVVDCPLCPEVDTCCGSASLGSICGITMEDTGPAPRSPGPPPKPFDGIGDVSIPIVPINLIDESGVVVGTTLTDTNGCFIFEDVPQGPYSVSRTFNPSFEHIAGPVIDLVNNFHYTARKVCFLDYVP